MAGLQPGVGRGELQVLLVTPRSCGPFSLSGIVIPALDLSQFEAALDRNQEAGRCTCSSMFNIQGLIHGRPPQMVPSLSLAPTTHIFTRLLGGPTGERRGVFRWSKAPGRHQRELGHACPKSSARIKRKRWSTPLHSLTWNDSQSNLCTIFDETPA